MKGNHMKLKTTKLLLASSLLIATGIASAADPAGYYGGLSVGRSRIDSNLGGIDGSLSSAAGLNGLSSSIDRNDTGFKLRFGYDFVQGLAVEAGYIDFGKAAYNGSFTGGSASGSIKASGVNLDLLGKLPLSQNVTMFGKAGMLFSSLKTEASANGVSIGDTSHRVVPGLGFGMDYSLTRSLALRAEVERYYRLGNDNTGKSDADLLSVGLNARF
jgi:OOP family OmpA-OmpF porin